MAKDTRKWWKKKTNIGIIVAGIGGIIAAGPAAAVITTIGTIPITFGVVAETLKLVGGLLAGYGIADRAGRNRSAESD